MVVYRWNSPFERPNEPAGKVLLTSENDVFGGHLILPKHEIVDCGAFYEITFPRISPKNLLGDFFYSLNDKAHREPDLSAIRWSRLLSALGFLDTNKFFEFFLRLTYYFKTFLL
jgi:hypothetical protein